MGVSVPRNRDFAERRKIIRAYVAEDTELISGFDLDEGEQNYYHSRAARALDKTARQTSHFSAYYALPTAQPFLYVVIPSLLIVAAAAIFAILIYSLSDDPSKAAPIFAACLTITVIALGWTFVGWNSHNNTVRQNTNNILFARFAHQPFSEAVHRFHMKFGHGDDPRIEWETFCEMRKSTDEEDRKAAAALAYLLNYYEFIASGVIRGDLDKKVIRDNIKGTIIFYHDKCWPVIRVLRKTNPLTFEFLSKIRAHYRET